MNTKTGHSFDVHVENYVKAIWNLQSQKKDPHGFVKNSEIADYLGVKRPTVTEMLRKISAKKIIQLHSPHGVKLTSLGKKLAIFILRKHRLIELFLSSTLDLNQVELHEEAEILEHAISEKLLKKIDKFLKFPKLDLQGMPIPTEDDLSFNDFGTSLFLGDLKKGDVGIIHSLPDYDFNLLKNFLDQGLQIGNKIKVNEVSPPDFISFIFKGKMVVLPMKLADQIRIQK